MSEQPFAALTRQAAAAISRRRSLLTLGGAGAALAALASPAVNAGRKKQDPDNKCKRQVGRCGTSWEDVCDELNCEPAARAGLLECCGLLRTCGTADYNVCVLAELL